MLLKQRSHNAPLIQSAQIDNHVKINDKPSFNLRVRPDNNAADRQVSKRTLVATEYLASTLSNNHNTGSNLHRSTSNDSNDPPLNNHTSRRSPRSSNASLDNLLRNCEDEPPSPMDYQKQSNLFMSRPEDRIGSFKAGSGEV